MNNHLIDFTGMPWVEPGKGLKYKVFKHGNQQLRLAEFVEGFTEPDWCTHFHAGYVLEGCFSVDFNGQIERYGKGDVFFIPQGNWDRHKAVLAKDERVLLLLFETT